jgi:hypothetical protein
VLIYACYACLLKEAEDDKRRKLLQSERKLQQTTVDPSMLPVPVVLSTHFSDALDSILVDLKAAYPPDAGLELLNRNFTYFRDENVSYACSKMLAPGHKT